MGCDLPTICALIVPLPTKPLQAVAERWCSNRDSAVPEMFQALDAGGRTAQVPCHRMPACAAGSCDCHAALCAPSYLWTRCLRQADANCISGSKTDACGLSLCPAAVCDVQIAVAAFWLRTCPTDNQNLWMIMVRAAPTLAGIPCADA